MERGSARAVEVNSPRVLRLWLEIPLTLVILAVFLGVILGVSLALGLASVSLPPAVFDLDLGLYRAIVTGADPRLTRLVFIFLNDPGVDYSVAIAACLGYVWWKRRRDMVGAVAAVALALVVGASTMPYTQSFGFRPRPFTFAPDVPMDQTWRQIWAGIPTFPSGHIRELAGLCLVLGYFWPRARWVAAAYLVLVAFSRVYIGAHFPTDVLAGVFVGLLAGTFSVVAVDRGTRIAVSAASTGIVSGMRDYLLGRRIAGRQESDPFLAVALRSALFLGVLLALAFALGSMVYVESPRILADYLRNTDNSLVYPIFGRFSSDWAPWVYGVFADGSKTYPALSLLILGYSAWRGKKSLGRGALAVIVAFAVVQIMAIVFSAHFERPRPLSTGEVALPDVWRARWDAAAVFPDQYLLTIMALCAVLAGLWKGLRIPAYIYPFLVSASLLYFGAAWPTDVLATLVSGYFVGRYALLVSGQFVR